VAAAHASQQAIQLSNIAESGVVSDAAVAILGWTTQEVLDAAQSIGLASSSQLPSEQPGVCVSDAAASPGSPVNHQSSLMQEQASPDTPPKVSVPPFERISDDFRLPGNSTQSQIPTHSSSTDFRATKLTHKLKTAFWPKMNLASDQVLASFAWGSPHIQDRRFRASKHNKLAPLDESHVRMWLRELYPGHFNPVFNLNATDYESMQLEEVRALFRAILSGHIKRVWFQTKMFNSPVGESLHLVLVNQRNRFLLSYYKGIFVDYPQDEETNRFIWRYVFELIAHDNQIMHSGLWRTDFHSRLYCNQTLLGTITDTDEVIQHLLGESQQCMPPSTNVFDTTDSATYDTLSVSYEQRKFAMVPVERHQVLSSLNQRYKIIQALQQPTPVQGG
jgi:hypothetical protein